MISNACALSAAAASRSRTAAPNSSEALPRLARALPPSPGYRTYLVAASSVARVAPVALLVCRPCRTRRVHPTVYGGVLFRAHWAPHLAML